MTEEASTYSIQDLSPHLFWDVDKSKLNWSRSAHYIIERVAYLGSFFDWQLIIKIYGATTVKSVLVNVRYMDEKSLNYYALIFDMPKEKFRCYKSKQLQTSLLPF